MNYELAKQLKDMGFPQYPKHVGLYNKKEMDESMDRCIIKSGGVVQPIKPTLSELIEACGGKFHSVQRRFGHIGASMGQPNPVWWSAKDTSMDESQVGETGSTPEEAVARLWLALNQK